METPEQLYAKRFYLTEVVKAIYDDFHALGAPKEEEIYEQKYGPFEEESEVSDKRKELEELRREEKKELGNDGLIKKLGIKKPTATLRSPVPPYEKKSYEPHEITFSYITYHKFEPV